MYIERNYKSFREMFDDALKIKQEVRMLYGKDLIKYKDKFYRQPFKREGLDWFWSFIWDEISYIDLKRALHL